MNNSQYMEFFHQIYNIKYENSAEYANPYRQRQFDFDDDNHNSSTFKEWVILCPVKFQGADISPYYISKEYHVAPYSKPYKPGRFLIGSSLLAAPNQKYDTVILAEEPATPYSKSGLNIELFYLRMRKHIFPGIVG